MNDNPLYWFGCLAVIAFLFSFLSTPLFRRLALATDFVDRPAARKVHKASMPYLGGMAFFVALVGIFVCICLFWPTLLWDSRFKGALLGSALLLMVGLLDDLKPVPESLKLLSEIGAALIAFYSGFRVEFVNVPIISETIPLDGLGVLVTIAWIVGLIVAINFIDGLDGLAAGVVLIASLSLVAVVLPGSRLTEPGSIIVIVVGAILVGGTAGFLPYNFHPARIFMGDAGSTVLGYLLAIMAIGTSEKATALFPLAIPVLGLAIPIYDTLTTVVRRTRKGKNLFWMADREHIHHRLLNIGVSHRTVVLLIYFASACFGILAYIVSGVQRSRLMLLLLVIIAAIWVSIQVLKFIEDKVCPGHTAPGEDKKQH